MESPLTQHFNKLSGDLGNLLCSKDYEKAKVNAMIDELNAQPYKLELFVRRHTAVPLISALCQHIKPTDEFLAAKTSHLLNSIITKTQILYMNDTLWESISWHIHCLKKCSEVVMLDMLHNMQSILQYNPQAASKFTDELIGSKGILLNLLYMDKDNMLTMQNPLQITLQSLKCIYSISSQVEDKSTDQSAMAPELKDKISQVIINFLMKGSLKLQDEFLYCKVVISALRVLTQLYLNGKNVNVPMQEVMGICKYYIMLGLINQGTKPEKVMPSQQIIAPLPIVQNAKGGKKQKLRKQRNSAIESLKKEIPVCDNTLLRDVGNFENSTAYRPASQQYFESISKSTAWALTSDSDLSDVESGREAKLVALRARVRQSAANFLLVLVKITERREMFGYWWSLLPDSPDDANWASDEAAQTTLAYCAVYDPVATSRAGVLSVILALLSGSRPYLSQAESSKKDTASFIPFSVSLGYMLCCVHTTLVHILDTERVGSVQLLALKCCAALLQATPYHKMRGGLLSEVVRASRKFVRSRDVKLQVGALITVGCVLSVDPKVDEIHTSIVNDSAITKPLTNHTNIHKISPDDECDDFEEGYSDDEDLFTEPEEKPVNNDENVHYFKSWILDICFRNLGWSFRGEQIVKCKPSAVPVILESLQVIAAMSFHHFPELIQPHLTLLADILCGTLQYDHQDVTLQAARTISVVGDAIQKSEQSELPPPLQHCIYSWERLLTPLSAVLQCTDNAPAKAVACDCIANVGERTFGELPRRVQVLCCALLIGSCSDEEATVRAAAVRALAMTVMYRSLREDIGFVSDCGENILRALAEPSLVVRMKAAWALGNLSDALVLNIADVDIDDIDDDLLYRLLEVGVHCAGDNDKVKMSAMRGLGNILRLIKEDNLKRIPPLRPLCETAIQKLMDCAVKVTNMKVRWNACYAMGNAMKNGSLFTCFTGWQRNVFSSLSTLAQDCKNLKVRINAATALRACASRSHYGAEYPRVWSGILQAMESAQNVDDFSEHKHKDQLVEQLTVTLAHLCRLLQPSDLSDILDPLVFHCDTAKAQLTHLCHKLAPENASCLRILEAAKYVTAELTAVGDSQQQALAMLQDIFVWDI